MGTTPDFLTAYLSQANTLLNTGCVKEPIFARGAYHIGVQDINEEAFAFLQITDEGALTDFFCTCKNAESGSGCPHLAAAYLQIFNGTEEPLHVRFRKSFWNKLLQMESKRSGYTSDACTKTEEGAWKSFSKTKKELFSIQPKTTESQETIQRILERKDSQEETSFLFSQLSSQEIEQYKKGSAGHLLRYELSFWSELAKYLMHLQEIKEPYSLRFEGSPIPHEVSIDFASVSLQCYISDVHFPWIIPSLNTVNSPLRAFDSGNQIVSGAVYNEQEQQIHLYFQETAQQNQKTGGVQLGEWTYFENEGFYRKAEKSLFPSNIIEKEGIGEILSKGFEELSPFLSLHADPIKPQYRLFLDDQESLHIRPYLFTPDDLQEPKANLFLPWSYLPQKGFYKLEEWMFEEKEKIVPKNAMADFINKHRVWLHHFPGFQTHLGTLESHLTYGISPEKELFFDVELAFPLDEAVSFDEWIYIRGQGFYMKKASSGRLPLHPGLRVPKEEIPSFIRSHKEELEQVHGFFLDTSPIEETKLSIHLNEEKKIEVVPHIRYAPYVNPDLLEFFDDFIWVKNKGFAQIPHSTHILEKYRKTVVLPTSQETSFLSYELDPLKPYILELDPKIQTPKKLQLKLRKVLRDTRRKEAGWLVDFAYDSDIGSTDIFPIWDAITEKKHHLFSEAGLLFLKDMRFHWIRQLSKGKLDRKKGLIRLSTLEWARLTAFEQIEEPKGTDPKSVETRKLLHQFSHMETNRMLDISGLKSTLRPYQEQGLHWLWFLYCHGLSGLLCDDMGLGKTHQAMALLAAVTNTDPDRNHKYLVVCPTSVIYHWQELLKKFIPEIRVCVYYGVARSLERFDTEYDLLLTSYGVLRSAKDELRMISFETAFFDEIQVAKNYASQTHKALRCIRAKMRLGLTGTPIENRIREIKSLFDVVLPSYLPSDTVFRELFIRPIEKEGDEKQKAILAKLVKPFILRRKKSEVLRDLPEKIEEISYCDLSADQKTLYTEIAEKMKQTVYRDLQDTSKPVPYLHVFSALSQLKRVCDHPCLIDGSDCKQYKKKQSGKWDLFTELLEEARASGQKVVVFSQYLEMLAIIEMHLKKEGIGFASIKGSTRDRNEQLRKFREDPACEVFVASLLAAGVGIDLTVASIVIHYDRWWNPAKENQATDRVHRIGQSRGVQVFKLVTKNTIEEHIHEIIENKKGLLENIIGTDDQINYLTREEILTVFKRMLEELS